MKRLLRIPSRINAGALYFVLFLLFLLTLLLASYILFIHYKNILFHRQVQISQIEQNIESVVELYQIDPSIAAVGSISSFNLFEGEVSPVHVFLKQWGGYKMLFVKAFYKELSREKVAMVGYSYGSVTPTAIYIPDNNRFLSICGNTEIRGSSYVPRLGYKPARIEGTLFSGYFSNDKDLVHYSESELPRPEEELLSSAHDIIEWRSNGIQKQRDFLLKTSDVRNSFHDSLVIVNYQDSLGILSNAKVSGNVLIRSSENLTLSSSCKLENVIVMAPKITVESGFEGSVQLFATDSVIIKPGVKLHFPSVIALLSNSVSQSGVSIRSSSVVNGSVWLYAYRGGVENLSLTIEQGATINGQVYCNGKVEHRGIINGTLMASLLTVKTAYAYYENFLFNAKINAEGIPEYFACLPLVLPYSEMQFIKWVY